MIFNIIGRLTGLRNAVRCWAVSATGAASSGRMLARPRTKLGVRKFYIRDGV